ncbi:MAG: amino acid permease [Bacteroidia bacterium]|nr:amino acid permease [Bacteroidia bacterium]
MSRLFRRKSINSILAQGSDTGEHSLQRNLSLRDLTSLGIAAIIGAGIFSTIGNASASGGPAVILLFAFIAVACSFSAMSYAEFASSIPISGSAYTYAYASFGELIAWIIGWALIVEYAIGNIVVAISWSDYFTGLMDGMGWHIPEYFTMDYFSAKSGYLEVEKALAATPEKTKELWEHFTNTHITAKHAAWVNAPEFFGLKVICDLPALAIVFAITALIYRGVHETKTVGNYFVGLKLIVIILVIIVGAFYVNPAHWSPFAPNGLPGVLKGVASVFFAYIGFDALATTAEECKNPKRDLPKAMIASLIICTVLYILIALTLTGLVNYKELGVGDPLAHAFSLIHVDWMSGLVAVSAVIAMASVLLVFQNGQPRIWMSMSRDGLLPRRFSKIHPKFKSPSFSTLVTGAMVAIPALFMNLQEVTDLSSIGTLFAFVLVNAGVIQMETHRNEHHVGFRVPYYNGRLFIPLLCLISLFVFIVFDTSDVFFHLNERENWPTAIFWVMFITLGGLSYKYRYSVIPVLGMVSNFYLMTQLNFTNWAAFIIWLLIGLIVYFLYGYRHSKLNKPV